MYQPTFGIFSTVLFYILVCSLIVFFAYRGEQQHKSKYILWAYIILGLLTILRYDIGNDYAGYAYDSKYMLLKFDQGWNFFNLWSYDEHRHELFLYFSTWFFSWMPHPYVGVIGSYGIISIWLLYKALNRVEGYHTLGLLMYMISGIMFNSWDWVRQSVSFMIVLYALYYIEKGKPIHYFASILVGVLFHNTILLMLPFYYVRVFRVPNIVVVSVLFTVLALYFVNFFQDALGQIMAMADLAEGYQSYAESEQALEVADSIMFKLRTTLYVIIWASFIFLMPKTNYVKKNLMLIGAVFFIIASGSQVLMRISFYFIVISIIAAPCAYHANITQRIPLIKLAVISMLFVLSGLWVRDIATGNNRGCTPYDSILLNNFSSQKFRPKSY